MLFGKIASLTSEKKNLLTKITLTSWAMRYSADSNLIKSQEAFQATIFPQFMRRKREAHGTSVSMPNAHRDESGYVEVLEDSCN